jgi:hypothetical protein
MDVRLEMDAGVDEDKSTIARRGTCRNLSDQHCLSVDENT